MSLLDRLIDKGLDAAEKKGANAVLDLLSKAEDYAAENLDPESAALAKGATLKLGEVAPELANLGHSKLTNMIAKTALVDLDAAKAIYLGDTFEQRRAASHAAGAAVVADRLGMEQDWEAVKDVLQGLGKGAMKLLPVLLAL